MSRFFSIQMVRSVVCFIGAQSLSVARGTHSKKQPSSVSAKNTICNNVEAANTCERSASSSDGMFGVKKFV